MPKVGTGSSGNSMTSNGPPSTYVERAAAVAAPAQIRSPWMLDQCGQLRSFSSRGAKKRRAAKEEEDDKEMEKEQKDEAGDERALEILLTMLGLGALGFVTVRVLMPRFGLAGVITGYSAGVAVLAFFTSLPTQTLIFIAGFPFACWSLHYLATDYRDKTALEKLDIPVEARHDDNVWHKFQNDRVRITYCAKDAGKLMMDSDVHRAEDGNKRRQYLCRRHFFLSPWDCVEEEIKHDDRIEEMRRKKGLTARI